MTHVHGHGETTVLRVDNVRRSNRELNGPRPGRSGRQLEAARPPGPGVPGRAPASAGAYRDSVLRARTDLNGTLARISGPGPGHRRCYGIRNSLSCWRTRSARASRCPGSESAKDVKAARRFAELQRRAPIRAPRARKRAINRYVIIPPWRLKRIACSARSLALQLQTVQKQQIFW